MILIHLATSVVNLTIIVLNICSGKYLNKHYANNFKIYIKSVSSYTPILTEHLKQNMNTRRVSHKIFLTEKASPSCDAGIGVLLLAAAARIVLLLL